MAIYGYRLWPKEHSVSWLRHLHAEPQAAIRHRSLTWPVNFKNFDRYIATCCVWMLRHRKFASSSMMYPRSLTFTTISWCIPSKFCRVFISTFPLIRASRTAQKVERRTRFSFLLASVELDRKNSLHVFLFINHNKDNKCISF